MGCKELCKKYKAEGIPFGGRYAAGQKRCYFCDIYMYVDSAICPCCKSTLRTNPRKSSLKEKLRDL